ncbi:MAG: LPS assembly lipoprotein LptE [Candidatus Binatia bacterium]
MKGKRQKAKGKTKICLAAFLLVIITAMGCAYQFTGRGEAFPKDVRTVFIEPLVNRTREVGLDRELMTALKIELHQKGQLQVVGRLEEADAVLSGVLRVFDSRVVGVNRHDEALQYELVLTLDMSLRRRSPDQLLWRTQGARFTDLYVGSRGAVVTTSPEFRSRTLNPGDVRQLTDIQLTETAKQNARVRLMESAAHDLHARLLEMF